LDSLTDSSESEIKEKQKEADDLKFTNTQLKSQVEQLNGSIKDLQDKVSLNFFCSFHGTLINFVCN
jgi:predicted  nucleic acid-binding Zn-ribbon protein